jgi:hypothetical protein
MSGGVRLTALDLPDQSLAATGHLPMQAAWTLASAGQDDRLLRTYMSASPVRPRVRSLPTAGSGQRHGDLASLLHVDAGCGPRRSELAVPGAGERGEPCVVLGDSRERAHVSLPAGAAAIFPPWKARHGL